ncbi:unnamed protein product [Albugo candida]|uniref:Uncharacterized protein n=1 Tax=Albugo candida TaxID=65357 RepID=A0A024GHJ8_9STRA|nr:unnamed protein product [Albugo candida]|eukprot:CCI45961.1 unnamed protein product [Albugo candida]
MVFYSNSRTFLPTIALVASLPAINTQFAIPDNTQATTTDGTQENLHFPLPNGGMDGPGVVQGLQLCGGLPPILLSSNIDVWLTQQTDQIKEIFRCSTFPEALGCSCQRGCVWNPSGIEGAPPCMSKDSVSGTIVIKQKKKLR